MPFPAIYEVIGRDHIVALSADEQQRRFKYMVTGLLDDESVRALVESTIPAFYDGNRFSRYTLKELGGGNWEVDVIYARKLPGFLSLDFEYGGLKQKITKSYGSVYYPADGQQKIDFQNSINVTKRDGIAHVEGLEIDFPHRIFTITRTFGMEDYLDSATLEIIDQLEWCVNSEPIDVTIIGIDQHFDEGELLFMGSTAKQKSGGQPLALEDPRWEGDVILRFGRAKNLTNQTIAGIPNVNKNGWDYLWVAYEQNIAVDVNKLVPKALQVCVEKVFPYDDLTPLFFGGGE